MREIGKIPTIMCFLFIYTLKIDKNLKLTLVQYIYKTSRHVYMFVLL